MKIPLDEIDLILVNQQSKGPDYLVQDADRISVYPVFELFDISEFREIREKPLRNPIFICDVHLGRLSRFLRMLGFDTVYSSSFTPKELVERSNAENRILLSKSYRLTHHPEVRRACLIRSSDPEEQITDMIDRLHLAGLSKPFTRCLNCNSELRQVTKPDITHQLQPKTAKYYNEFLRCPSCDLLFWEGSHYEHMTEFIHRLLPTKPI
jgi:hypothetical protein